MEENTEKLAIVGIFWDGYYDLWEDFLDLKERFWPDCPYNMYIVNEEKVLNYEKKYNVRVLSAGKDALYSRKVQYAIENIMADYYLLLLEDFFFSRPLQRNVLESNLSMMDKYSLEYLKMPLKEFIATAKGTPFHNIDNIISIRNENEYTLTCQPSIWKRDFLKKCIGDGNYNAWVFEGIYAKSRLAHTVEFLNYCKIDKSNKLGLVHGALQGKMLPKTVSKLEATGYKMKNQREVMSLKDNYLNELKDKLKGILPLGGQRVVKKILKTESVIERYEKEIEQEIINMGIK